MGKDQIKPLAKRVFFTKRIVPVIHFSESFFSLSRLCIAIFYAPFTKRISFKIKAFVFLYNTTKRERV